MLHEQGIRRRGLEPRLQGQQAEARVGGVLRGGFVLGDRFYTNSGSGPFDVPVSHVSDLRYAPYLP